MNEYDFIFILIIQIGISYCTSMPNLKSINDDHLIPLIIGFSLMGFVIIILLASLCVCFIIHRNSKNKKGTFNDLNGAPETIKLVDYKLSKLSKLNELAKEEIEQNCKNSPTFEKSNLKLPPKASLQISKIHRYRRASVPAVLSTLHEASPSMEASSRKMSLSYNCILEPLYDNKRNTFSDYNNKEMMEMPESGPGTEINSRQDSNEKQPPQIIKKYSIFNDEELFMMPEKSKYGQIVFSICYDLSAKVLEVTVNHAKYLLGYGTKRKNHYYVKNWGILIFIKTRRSFANISEMKLNMTCNQFSTRSKRVNIGCTQYMSTNSLSGVPDKNVTKVSKTIKGSFRTTIKSDFCNPIFEESFKFTNVTATILKECNLQFIIKEETPKFLEKNLIIGCADFDLEEAGLIEKHESINEIIRDLTPFGQIEDKGKVVLSLEYNRHLSKLCVCVIRVICASDQLTDVSVEIFLRSIDSIIVSRKVELDYCLKNGRVENFAFDSCLLGSLCLVFVFSARIRNCSKTPFGRLIIGPIQFASGSRLAHWTEICSVNRNVKMTHDII